MANSSGRSGYGCGRRLAPARIAAQPRGGLAHNFDLDAVDVVSFIQWAGGPTAPSRSAPLALPPLFRSGSGSYEALAKT